MVILVSIKQTAYLRFSELPWQCAMSNKIFKFYPSIVKTQLREKTRLRFHFADGLKWKWNCLILSLIIYTIRNMVFAKHSRQRAEFTRFSRGQRFPLAIICGWNKNARCFIFPIRKSTSWHMPTLETGTWSFTSIVRFDADILGFFEDGSTTSVSWTGSADTLTVTLELLQRARGETSLLTSCFL